MNLQNHQIGLLAKNLKFFGLVVPRDLWRFPRPFELTGAKFGGDYEWTQNAEMDDYLGAIDAMFGEVFYRSLYEISRYGVNISAVITLW